MFLIGTYLDLPAMRGQSNNAMPGRRSV